MRLYRTLLYLYPASFRHEYGEEMVRLFGERHRALTRGARLLLWLEALEDALLTAPRVHLDLLHQDLRYTRRTLARSPGFAAAGVLLTALAIGATTSVFSITDRVLFRPLPFKAPERLVQIWEKVPGYARMEASPANHADWRAMAHSFESIAAHHFTWLTMIHREPERVEGAAVTSDLLPVLGVQPMLGRLFLPQEDKPGAEPVAILSDRLWRRAFDADPTAVGKRIRLNQHTYLIVGVMPPDFYFPDRETEIWIPMQLPALALEDRDNNMLDVVARLKPAATLEGARGDMDAVMEQLERAHPRENAQSRATVRLLGDQVPSQSRLLIRVLAGASLCVLLIACSNLAMLLLTRLIARRREITVRAALGAGRERLIRQLLTESIIVALAGGVLGVALAAVATPLLSRLVPVSLPVADATVLDLRVLLFAALATMTTGIAFGVLPARRVCRGADAGALREGPRGGAGTGRERLRAGLIVAQITASILLLVCAGLLMRALVRVQTTDPGFRAEHVFTARTALESAKYERTAARTQFYDRVLAEVRRLPGVTSAAYISFLPMTMRGGVWPVEIPGQNVAPDSGDGHRASLRFITPEFFTTLGVPLRRGRAFTDADTLSSQSVVVVSESFVQRYWPNGDPLGRSFTFAFRERTIVGVVGDIRVRGLERVSEPQVYLPYQQVPDGGLIFYAPKDLVVRTSGEPLAITAAVRDIVRQADPELPVSNVRSLEEVMVVDTAPRRTQVVVLGLFAAISLLLAGVGVHSLLAFAVAQRRQEIGVRVALGAQRGAVVRLILGESVALACIGTVLGVGLAYATGRQLAALLAGVPAGDVVTYAGAAALVWLMTLSGSMQPVLRALRVDPARALRAD